MREIKFRIWLGKRFWFFDLSTGFNSENKDVCSDPQQYTGLCDKNGKEIFEGDIISSSKYMWKVDGEKQVRPVFYADGCFSIGKVALNILFPQFHPEVIGNIHETPELLK